MSALVERGIPRDFLDIFELCKQELCTVQQCWQLWQEREKKRGVEKPEVSSAVSAVFVHLKRIEQMRPLHTISDEQERNQANEVRQWFKNEFTREKK